MIFSLAGRMFAKIGSMRSTLAARESARLSRNVRFSGSGRITNILGDRDAITIGENCVIKGEILTFAHGGRVSIGEWSYVGPGSQIWSALDVTIGKRVLISYSVNVHDNDAHPLDAAARFKQTQAIFQHGHPRADPGISAARVVICDDAWIGFAASVLKGVTIGEGAVVAACAVVTKDVEPYTVVAGSPAKFVRSLEPK
jgi:acetyltransferase-like isoleucine patch superfamily enzyme